MTYPLRKIDIATPYTERQPGDYWLIPLDHRYDGGETYADHWAHELSPEFTASGRTSVLFIRLPGNCGVWSPDHKASDAESGWTLTGEEPNWSAHPSVNAVGCYHGWLKDGSLVEA